MHEREALLYHQATQSLQKEPSNINPDMIKAPGDNLFMQGSKPGKNLGKRSNFCDSKTLAQLMRGNDEQD